jgi:septum formation protein
LLPRASFNFPMKRLLLASSSPRRSALLKATGLIFEIARPNIDETPHPGEPADQYVARLSLEKALAAAANASGFDLILTADTTVADGAQILGKPENADDAFAMLRQLRDRTHYVHTGVSLLDTATGELSTTVTTTEVIMRPYTDAAISAYIESGDPFGKAGSYAIQNEAFHPVERVDGCYANVVGLPVCTVRTMLAAHGIESPHPITCSPINPPCLFRGVTR